MSTFRYRAKDGEGKLIAGKIDAASITIAEQVLEEKNLEVVVLEEVRERFHIPFALARVKSRDIVVFSRQLATLIASSIPLVQSLRTMIVQTPNPELKKTLVQVADDVEAGMRLSLAMGKHEQIFGTFFVNMIRSGETAGRLSEVLGYLADQTEKEYDLVSKVRGAMIYPAFIISGMIIVGTIMLVFVIPQLTAVLTESGVELPLMTKILIGASNIAKHYWWLVLILVLGGGIAFKLGLRKPSFRRRVDTLVLRVPILGPLFQKIYLARVTRSLQILLSGGVDTVAALSVVGEVVGNAYYAALIDRTRRAVEDGSSITSVLVESPLVPPMVSQMMAVGEETGKLTSILEKLTSFYTREVDNGVTTLVSVIEPLLMMVIGLGVGVVVSAIILPMYKLAGQF